MKTVAEYLFVLAATLLLGPATAFAQECQTQPLAFDVYQGGELGPDDCLVPGDICTDCGLAPGEYWTLETVAGELVLITVQGTTGEFGGGRAGEPLLRAFDATGRRVGYYWQGDCNSRNEFRGYCLPFKAETSGTYRILVYDDGYLRPHFGGYAVQARRVTTTLPGALLWYQANGNRVSFYSNIHLAPSPVLEYVMEVGSAPQAGNFGVFSLGARAGWHAFEAVPNGTYFFRVRARTASGWGPPSNDASVTATDGPQGLSAQVNGQTVTLRWSPPASDSPFYGYFEPVYPPVPNPSSSYELLVGSSPGSTSLGTCNVGLASNPFHPRVDVAEVPPGTYYVRVRGRTPAGVTAPSNEIVVTVPSQ